MINLADLLAKDLSTVDMEELAAGIRDAELTGDQAPQWSRQLILELRERGMSWSALVQLTGLPQSRLWRRANRSD